MPENLAEPPRLTPEQRASAHRRRVARDAALTQIASGQHGVVNRRQLRQLGVERDVVRRRIAGGRWALRTPNVVSLTTGPATADQLRWIAVLHAVEPVALAGRTALELHGLRGWEDETVDAIVRVGAHHPVEGVRYHRSRRPFADWTVRRSGLPVLLAPIAALLLASRLRSPRSAAGVLAACVQQRRTSADELGAWIGCLPALGRAKLLSQTIDDLAGGAQSLAEIDLGEICAAAGIAPPTRQTERRDSAGGRRWTDAEWELPDGTVVVLEVDGGFHLEVAHWIADKQRQRRLSGSKQIVVGCTAIELRTTPDAVTADLIALGVPRIGHAA